MELLLIYIPTGNVSGMLRILGICQKMLRYEWSEVYYLSKLGKHFLISQRKITIQLVEVE